MADQTPPRVKIVGDPVPQGSMTCVGQRGRHQLVPSNAKILKPWRRLVTAAGLLLTQRAGGTIAAGAVRVEVTVTLDRPASVKPSARRWPSTKTAGHGDVDKLARAILDGLTDAGVYRDDAQVCELHIRKVHPDTLDALTEPEPWTWSTPALDRPGVTVAVHPIE